MGSTDGYEYHPELHVEHWPHVRSFVLETLAAARGRTAYSEKELAAALGPYALWCWRTGSAIDTSEQMLNVAVIEYYIAEGLTGYTKAGRGTIRSRLLRLAEAFGPDVKLRQPLRAYSGPNPSKPYALLDQAGFTSWARSQGTRLRSANAAVLLSLGFGAGLSNEEIISVRRGDIIPDELGLLLDLKGKRSRRIPVLELWSPALLQASWAGEPDEWAFLPGRHYRSANLTGLFISKSDAPVRLQTRRMRATWIVHHLNRGTPAVPLLEASGLKSIDAFDQFLPFVPKWTESRTIWALK
ncbi:hypothetical protein [Agromyces allii]|uniref:Tyr recombinase domain-containing protein n=1 Tax=Agromyces allii TaxID=393607 RepID=A0ABN2QMU1_9MICO|nr:hypothetical protein [Agromyces allii]